MYLKEKVLAQLKTVQDGLSAAQVTRLVNLAYPRKGKYKYNHGSVHTTLNRLVDQRVVKISEEKVGSRGGKVYILLSDRCCPRCGYSLLEETKST